jgi:hypothetical protein
MFKSFGFRIYLVALILRIIPVILARGLGIGLDDMFQYDMLARSLAAGHGFRWYAEADLTQLQSALDALPSLSTSFDLTSVKNYDPALGVPTSFRAPLYPAFLAIVYFINGTDFSRFFAARLAQAIVLGAPLAPLTYGLAQRLFGVRERRAPKGYAPVTPANWRTPKIAAWIVAAYPLLLVYPLGLGTENPFFVLLLASFLFLLKSIEKPIALHFLLAGLFLGLTALTRSVILPFAGLAILWVWLIVKQKHGAVLLGLAFGLTITPWMIRNSLLHQEPAGIETSMGYNLYLGYHPDGNGSFVFGPSLDLLPILDDAERDRVGTEKAIEFIRAEPERFIPLAINRLGFFFGLEKRVLMYFYGNNLLGYVPLLPLLAICAILLLPFVVISISAALGLSLLHWKPEHMLLGLLFIGYITPHVFILAEDRFHLALVPFFAILAAQWWENGFGMMRARWRESQGGKIIVAFAILCVLLLLTNWGLELIRDWDKIVQLLGPNGNRSYLPY